MANSSNRFRRFLKSSVTSLLQPAADPRTSETGPEQEQQALLAQVRGATARLTGTRQRIERHRTAVADRIGQMDGEARDALRMGEEDRARSALQRQRVARTELEQLDRQIAGLRGEEDRLTSISHRITAQIETIRARKQMAAARHSAARAHVAAGEALSGIGSIPNDSGLIEQIEREAEDFQARADAIQELTEAGVFGHPGVSFTHQTASGSGGASDEEIEHRLQQLKAELIAGS